MTVGGYDIVLDFRRARSMIGLVPQELTLGAFESVWNTLCFSRGLFGKKPNPAYIERLLKDLCLWNKKFGELSKMTGGRRLRAKKPLERELFIELVFKELCNVMRVGILRSHSRRFQS